MSVRDDGTGRYCVIDDHDGITVLSVFATQGEAMRQDNQLNKVGARNERAQAAASKRGPESTDGFKQHAQEKMPADRQEEAKRSEAFDEQRQAMAEGKEAAKEAGDKAISDARDRVAKKHEPAKHETKHIRR